MFSVFMNEFEEDETPKSTSCEVEECGDESAKIESKPNEQASTKNTKQ